MGKSFSKESAMVKSISDCLQFMFVFENIEWENENTRGDMNYDFGYNAYEYLLNIAALN